MKASQIKVSVVVPVYNVEKYLSQTLGYITGQTLREIEVICVDDGSTDSSREILKDWREKDARIQILTQQNQYAGVARNRGLERAVGKYVIFWDSDDIFEPEALEVLYKKAEKEEADICICAARRYDEQHNTFIASDAYLNKKILPEKNVFNKTDLTHHIFSLATNVPWNKLYRREFLTKHGLEYQAIRQANDTYFTMMAFFLASRITCVDRVLVAYRVNNSQSLSGKTSDTVFCALESYQYTLEQMKKYPEFEQVQIAFVNRALSGLFHSLNIQTSFASYKALYEKLVEDGFSSLGIDRYEEKDFQIKWQYRDMKKMQSMPAEDFLLQKSIERRLNAERLRSQLDEQKAKNADIGLAERLRRKIRRMLKEK